MNEVIMSLSEIELGIERAKADFRLAKAEEKAVNEAYSALRERKCASDARLEYARSRITAYEVITEEKIFCNLMQEALCGDQP